MPIFIKALYYVLLSVLVTILNGLDNQKQRQHIIVNTSSTWHVVWHMLSILINVVWMNESKEAVIALITCLVLWFPWIRAWHGPGQASRRWSLVFPQGREALTKICCQSLWPLVWSADCPCFYLRCHMTISPGFLWTPYTFAHWLNCASHSLLFWLCALAYVLSELV